MNKEVKGFTRSFGDGQIKSQNKTGPRSKLVTLIVILILALFTAVLCGTAYAKDNADYNTNLLGHGTADDPYIISSRADLDFLAYAINLPFSAAVNDTYGYLRDKHFALGGDIEMGGLGNPWTTPIGTGTGVAAAAVSNTNSFRGVFDGRGYTIKNMYYNAPNTAAVDNYGLFGVIGSGDTNLVARDNSSQAVIRNLNMTGVNIVVPQAAPKSSNIGALVGFADRNTFIENVKVSGTLTASNAENVGGVVGRSKGHAYNNSNKFRIIGAEIGVSGLNRVGGILGMGNSTTIAQSYSTGNIYVTSDGTAPVTECYAGGLIGRNEAQNSTENYGRDYLISDCYATGSIEATTTSGTPTMNIGGLLGRNEGSNSYIINSWFGGSIFTNVNTGTIRLGGILGFGAGNTVIRRCAVLSDNINQASGGDTGKVVAKIAPGTFGDTEANNNNNLVSNQISNATGGGTPFPGGQYPVSNTTNKEISPSLFNQASTWSDIGYNLTWMWKMTSLIVGSKGITSVPVLRVFSESDTGKGTSVEPFLISTAADMVRFRDTVNEGYSFAGQYIRLTSDITLTEPNWTPIGHLVAQPFEGHFDGGNKKISGLKVTHRASAYTGLFGYVNGNHPVYNTSSIKNLNLINPDIAVPENFGSVGSLAGEVCGPNVYIENITATGVTVKGGGSAVGGLIGLVAGGSGGDRTRLRNIHVEGNVYGRDLVGGVVGNINQNNATSISFIGDVTREIMNTVTIGSYFGGLFGQMNNSVLSNSYATGNIRDVDLTEDANNATDSRAGGLFGYGINNTVSNSYHAGGVIEGKPRAINQNVYVGGLAGCTTNTTTFINCFSAATAIRSYAPDYGSADTFSLMGYFVGFNLGAAYFKNNARMASTTLSPDKTYFNGEHITRILPLGDFKISNTFSRTAANNGMGWDMVNTWYINEFVNQGFPSLRSQDQTDASSFRGNGSAYAPYLIHSAASLRIFRDLVNANENYRNAHFLLTEDITLSGANWTPIGDVNNAFMGVFDGGGHTISGLYIDKAMNNRGFFGYTTNATIRNFTLIDPVITYAGGTGTGAVIGTATERLTVENVHVRGGKISNNGSHTGGIIGHANNGVFPVRIDNTSNSALIEGQVAGCGGLVGYVQSTLSNRTVITNSYNEGTVRQAALAGNSTLVLGGIVGYGQGVYISQCYNAGNVRGNTEQYVYHIGGLIGEMGATYNSTVRNSYNVGEIAAYVYVYRTSYYSLGGLVGYTSAPRTVIENSYNAGPVRKLYDNTVCISGIIGHIAGTTATINGTVSLGELYTYQSSHSWAWFANANGENSVPKVPDSKNNLYMDSSSVKGHIQFPASAAAYRIFHTGEGTASRTASELRRWATYEEIGWSDSIWEHDPLINNGLPYLKGMQPPASQSEESRTLYIRSLDDFIEFRDRVNVNKEHFADRKIVVETDLDLFQFPQWQPIGTAANRFAGHIDFKGHIVTGLRMNGATTDAGLFGVINNGARIENLIIDTPNIKASTNVGAVAGRIERDAYINNVRVQGDEGNIIGNGTSVGGLVGRIGGAAALAAWEAEITNSSCVANISGTVVYMGGLIGSAEGLQSWADGVSIYPITIRIYDCFATGTVKSALTGNSYYLGGFIGQMNGGIEIQRCYSSGNVTNGGPFINKVTSTYHVGGFAGYVVERNNFITDAFTVSNVSSNTAGSTGGFVGRIEGASTTIDFKNIYARGTVHTEAANDFMGGIVGRTEIPTTQFKISGAAAINPSVSGPNGANFIGRFGTATSETNLPGATRYTNSSRLDGMVIGRISTPTAFHDEYSNAMVNGVKIYSFPDYINWATWANKGYDPSVWQISATVNEGLPTLRGIPFEPKNSPGGPLDPIMINDYDQLVDFRSRVNAGETFYGLTVKLGNDIDLTNRPAWIPIGQDAAKYFAGTFDGDGKFIRGLHSANPGQNFGFFGFVKGAIIKNLGFIDCDITTANNFAGIAVGYSISQLTLDNVFAVNGSIHSTAEYVGGLVGKAELTQNVIRRSYVDNVSIRGKNYVGGLVAYTPSIRIEHSYFDAQLLAGVNAASAIKVYAGGIIGHAYDVAGLEQIQLLNVSVQGTISSDGIHHPVLGGMVGWANSNLGVVVRNSFVNSRISAITTTANGLAVASGFVGWSDKAYGMRIYNSAFAGGSLKASAPSTSTTHRIVQAYYGTSDRGAGVYSENNRINGESIKLLSDGTGYATGTATYLDQLGAGGDQDIIYDSGVYYKSKTTYEILGWNFDSVWYHDESVNDSLPYLRGMAAVVELLDAIIHNAETYLAADYNTATFARLQTEINWAKAYLATAGESVTREELFNVISRVRNAVAGLRAENSALAALVEYVETNLVPVKDQFVSFAQVDVLLRDSKIMLIRTATLTGDNIIVNAIVQQITASLNNAVNSLQIDRSILAGLLTKAQIKQQRQFTSDSWAPFAAALAAAVAVNNQTNPSISAVTTAIATLEAAMNSLVLDTSAIESLIAGAKDIPRGSLPTNVWNALQNAIGLAETAVENAANPIITLEDRAADLAVAESTLINAIGNAMGFTGTIAAIRAEIAALISEAQMLTATNYEAATWNILQIAIAAGNAALANFESTESQYIAARDALISAKAGLTMNLQPLRQAITNAKNVVAAGLVPGKTNEYFYLNSSGEVDALKGAISQAEAALINHATLTQDAMTSHIEALQSAIDLLVVFNDPLVKYISELKSTLGYESPGWTVPIGGTNKPYYNPDSFDALENQVRLTESRIPSLITADQLAAEYQLLMLARNNLSVNKSALNEAIANAQKVEERFVAVSSWALFKAELDNALNIYAKLNATFEDVSSATINLTARFNALVAERSIVSAQVDEWSTAIYVIENFRADTYNAFLAARNAASTAAVNASIAVLALQAAYYQMVSAHSSLLPDKTALLAEIADARDFSSAVYSVSSFNALTGAIAAAQLVNLDAGATYAQVKAARDNLADAVANLILNTDRLQELVDTVDGLTESHFVPAEWTKLMAEYALAVAFIAKPPRTADIATLDTRYTALRNLINTLAINTEALDDLIAEAEEILDRRSRYTNQSARDLEESLIIAIATKESGSSVEDVTAATLDLQKKILAMVSVYEMQLIRDIAKVYVSGDEIGDGSAFTALQTLINGTSTLVENGTRAQITAYVNTLKNAVMGFLKETNYTETSWAVYDTALTDAFADIALLPEVPPTLVFRYSIDGLVKTVELTRVLAEVSELTPADYSNWAVVLDAVDGTEELFKTGTAAEIAEKVADIEAAIAMLLLDITDLNSALSAKGGEVAANYTDNSFVAYAEAVRFANEIKASPTDVDDIAEAISRLNSAYDALISIKVSGAVTLREVIATYQVIFDAGQHDSAAGGGEYGTGWSLSTWNDFVANFNAAKAAVVSAASNAAAIAAYNNLRNAKDNLKENPITIDQLLLSELQGLYDLWIVREASEFEAGFGALTMALNGAATVLSMPEGTTDADIVAAINEINSAVEGLVEKEVIVVQLPDVTGITYNAATKYLSWDRIDDADGYRITINGAVQPDIIINSLNLSALPFDDYTITIVALGNGTTFLTSQAPAVFHFSIVDPGEEGKEKLDAPLNVRIIAGALAWSAVLGAEEYDVFVDGVLRGVTAFLSFDLSELALPDGTYSVCVRALASDKITSSQSEFVSYMVSSGGGTGGRLATPTGLNIIGSSLLWTAVPGAEGYMIFVDGTLLYTAVSTTSADLSSITADGVYQIHIVAVADGREPSLESAAITYVVDSAGETLPKLDTVTGLNITGSASLSWDAVAGAEGYQIFINGIMEITVTASPFNLATITRLVAGTAYAISIRATASGFENSDMSDTVTYTPLVRLDIPQNVSVNESTMTLTWDAVANAEAYNVYENGNLIATGVMATSFSLAAYTAPGTYSFTVVARAMGFIESDHSAAAVLTIGSPVQLDAPTGVAIDNETKVISWNTVAGAASYDVFFGAELVANVTGTSFDLTSFTAGFAPGVYAFHVVAKAPGSIDSAASGTASLTVSAPKLAAPVAVINGSTLEWNAVAGAEEYEITINDGTSDSVINTPNTFISLAFLTASGTYTISVVAKAAGMQSSDPGAAVIYTVGGAQLEAPSGVVIADGVVYWNAVTGAESYRVNINGVLAGTVTTRQFSLASLEMAGTYLIEIQAAASGRPSSELSAAAEYIVYGPGTEPELTQLDAPTGLIITGNTLSWTAVTGAEGYQIFVDGVFLQTVTGTDFDLSVFTADGSYELAVKAIADGFIPSELSAGATYTVTGGDGTRQQLAIVTGIARTGDTVTWTAVSGATGYQVFVDGELFDTVSGESCDLSALCIEGSYAITIRAIADGYQPSDLSAAFTYVVSVTITEKLEAVSDVNISGSVLSWTAVTGAENYTVYIDGVLRDTVSGTEFNLAALGLTDGEYSIAVRANAAGKFSSDFSAAVIYTVASGKLDAPADLSVTDKVLSWGTVNGAAGYEIYLNGTLVTTVTETSYDLGGLGAGTYNISIKAVAPGRPDSDASEYEYTVSSGGGTLDAPDGLSIDGTTLNWNGVANATTYEIIVDGAVRDTVTSTGFDLASLGLAAGSYRVQIRAKAIGFTDSALSAIVTYVVQQPEIPDEKLAAVTGVVVSGGTIYWNSVEGAERYEVSINGVIISTALTELDVSYMDIPGVYSVVVYALAAGKITSDPSAAVTFTIYDDGTSLPPGATKLGTPSGVAIDPDTGILSWNAVTGAAAYLVYMDGMVVATVSGTSYDASWISANGEYKFRVSAVAPGRAESDLSATATLTIDGSSEERETLDAPAIDLNGNILSWSSVGGASGYQIYVDGVLKTAVTETSCNLSSYITEPGVYQITVIAVAADKAPSAASNSVTYTVAAAAGKLDAPSGIVINNNVLSWTAVTGAEYYSVYVNGVKAGPGTTGTSMDIADLIREPGDYTILIRAHADGKLNSDYAEFKYYVQSVVTKLEKPSNLAVVINTLTWDAVDGADAYEIIVGGAVAAVVTGTAFDLLELGVGTHSITVRAIADSRPASDASASITHTVTQAAVDADKDPDPALEKLAKPDVKIIAHVIVWSAVENAAAYAIYADGKLIGTTENFSFDLREALTKPGEYKITVVAMAEGKLSSDRSNEISFKVQRLDPSAPELDIPGNITVKDTVISWDAVEGAEGYKIYINGKLYATVDASTTSYDLKDVGIEGKLDIKIVAISSLRPGSDPDAPGSGITYEPKIPNAFIGFLKDNLILVSAGAAGLIVLIILLIIIIKVSARKKLKKTADRTLGYAIEQLNKAGELAIYSEARPSDAEAQAKTMAQLKITNEAIAEAEALFEKVNSKGKKLKREKAGA